MNERRMTLRSFLSFIFPFFLIYKDVHYLYFSFHFQMLHFGCDLVVTNMYLWCHCCGVVVCSLKGTRYFDLNVNPLEHQNVIDTFTTATCQMLPMIIAQHAYLARAFVHMFSIYKFCLITCKWRTCKNTPRMG